MYNRGETTAIGEQMKVPTVSSIMAYGIKEGETNHFVPAARELRQKRAKVPPNCTLYLVYGGTFGQVKDYLTWPAMDGNAEELKMIRRTCRKRRWSCTYYIVEDTRTQ